MADITDPEIIRFTNETIRPLAESYRSLITKLKLAEPTINRLIAQVPNDASPIVDGRQAEGVSQLVGAHLHAMVAIRDATLLLATPEAEALIELASVRTPQIN